MKIHITKIYNQKGTAGLSQEKTAKIARKLGFHEMGIYRIPNDADTDIELGKRIDGIISSLQFGDIVFLQSPTWIGIRYDLRFIRTLKAYKNVKVAIFVHDVIPLAFQFGEEQLKATIEIYNYADLIILPSRAMYDYLTAHGLTVKKYILQEIWDYPISFELEHPKFNKRLFFTGAPTRFPFVTAWKYKTPLVLYTGEPFSTESLNVELRGYQHESILLPSLAEGGYGLVWPSGDTEEYYHLLQPYKVATFLAAGIPVIMKKGLVPAHLIESNGLGYVVDTLEEADAVIQSVTEEEYNRILERISEFNHLIKDGWFTKKMLTDAVMKLLNTSPDTTVHPPV